MVSESRWKLQFFDHNLPYHIEISRHDAAEYLISIRGEDWASIKNKKVEAKALFGSLFEKEFKETKEEIALNLLKTAIEIMPDRLVSHHILILLYLFDLLSLIGRINNIICHHLFTV